MNDSRKMWAMSRWWTSRHPSREFVDWLELGPRVAAVWYPEGGYDS